MHCFLPACLGPLATWLQQEVIVRAEQPLSNPASPPSGRFAKILSFVIVIRLLHLLYSCTLTSALARRQMALTQPPPSTYMNGHDPSWDETIVPVLRQSTDQLGCGLSVA